jgi:hypothetical protein
MPAPPNQQSSEPWAFTGPEDEDLYRGTPLDNSAAGKEQGEEEHVCPPFCPFVH